MNVKERIQAFNEKNPPFYIVDHDDGKFSLCLPLDFLRGEYEDFGQAAFDAYALENGESLVDDYGFRTHGNGYEWEAAFRQAFADDPNINKITFDCEAGGFFCYRTSLYLEHHRYLMTTIAKHQTAGGSPPAENGGKTKCLTGFKTLSMRSPMP